MKNNKLSLYVFFVLLFDTACGLNTPQGAHLAAPYDSVKWYFQCPQNPLAIPAGDERNLVFEGEGPFFFPRERLVDTPVQISGRLCPIQQLKRDIIFVIDVSYSMMGGPIYGNNDPLANHSCGRLAAIEAVIARIQSPDTRYSIVTFSSGVEKRSSASFATQAELFADIVPSHDATKIDEVICAAVYETNYADALTASKQIFTTSGRDAATKEIFFVSDGAPTAGHEGIAEADDLKNNGIAIAGHTMKATIATVMLGSGVATVLQNQIASKDETGAPIHAHVDHAADLDDILTRMSDNRFGGAELAHGAVGGSPARLDIGPYLTNGNTDFTLPPMNLNIDFAQTGYSLRLSYWDSHRNTVTLDGNLDWAD